MRNVCFTQYTWVPHRSITPSNLIRKKLKDYLKKTKRDWIIGGLVRRT